MKNRLPSDSSKSAFSLVELLVVIAIIGIIGSFAVPAVGNLLKGSALTQAANTLTDQAASARQHALTRNRVVEVRFYKFAVPDAPGESATDEATWRFRAVQFFEIADGGVANPTGKFARFPDTIMMNSEAQYSSILGLPANTAGASDPELPGGIGTKYKYVAFRFLPDGTTSLSPTGGPSNGIWFLTVHLQTDAARAKNGFGPGENQAHNFFTWMIDPLSGSTKVLRPGVK